ncbi:MAG: ABC transporter permease subunit [bacterium]|nr:ABC transporter permease subunit [bacterium]
MTAETSTSSAGGAQPGAESRSSFRISRVRILQLTGIVVFLGLWELLGARKPEWYSQPSLTLSELWRLMGAEQVLPYIDGSFPLLVMKSLGALLIGIVLSFIVGVTLGFLIGRYRVFRVALDPYLAAIYSVPRVAFVPIMVVWFGIADKFLLATIEIPFSRFVIASVVVACSVLIAFSTAAGVHELMKEYNEISYAFNLRSGKGVTEEWVGAILLIIAFLATAAGWLTLIQGLVLLFATVGLLVVRDRHMFLKILLPGAVPFLATGLRIAVQRALIAVIVAEFLIGVPGLGFVIRDARAAYNTDRLFAMALLLMVLGGILITITKAVESRLSSWRPKAF